MGGSIVECPNTFHNGEGLLGCNNDKPKVILWWNIIVEWLCSVSGLNMVKEICNGRWQNGME
jgi:hypothetical protein